MTTLMKAVVSGRYGSPDVLEIREVRRPEPQAGEVLVRVRATTVSRTDCGMLRPHPWFVRLVAGFLRPKRTILGMDLAGVVEAIADAYRYVETKQKTGIVVISPMQEVNLKSEPETVAR